MHCSQCKDASVSLKIIYGNELPQASFQAIRSLFRFLFDPPDCMVSNSAPPKPNNDLFHHDCSTDFRTILLLLLISLSHSSNPARRAPRIANARAAASAGATSLAPRGPAKKFWKSAASTSRRSTRNSSARRRCPTSTRPPRKSASRPSAPNWKRPPPPCGRPMRTKCPKKSFASPTTPSVRNSTRYWRNLTRRICSSRVVAAVVVMVMARRRVAAVRVLLPMGSTSTRAAAATTTTTIARTAAKVRKGTGMRPLLPLIPVVVDALRMRSTLNSL